MTLYYGRGAVVADWLRAGGGFVVSAALLLALPLAWPVALVVGAMAAVFAVAGVQTIGRQQLRIHLDDDGFEAWPRYGRVDWRALDAVALAYFSTRRDRDRGWFELKLGTPHGRLRVDSRMHGFEALARAALHAARRRGLPLSPATLANAGQLGVDLQPGEGA